MANLKFICILLSLITVSFGVSAECYTNTDGAVSVDDYISPPPITVQRDAPVGQAIFSTATSQTIIAVSCDPVEPSGVYAEMSMFSEPSNIEHVYKTNVDGVGVSLGTSWFFENPAYFLHIGYGASSFAPRTLTFVKIGNISPGIVNAGLLARIYGNGDLVNAVSYHLSATTIIPLACAITTPKLTFPLGNVPASEFGNTVGFVSAETNTQNLGLNCDTDANINVELSGTQNPDVSDTSVLALSGQGTAGVASGLGVQLLYNGEPLENNKNIVMKKSEGGQEMLPITARYYQTKTAVMPGDASTSATLILTYQ